MSERQTWIDDIRGLAIVLMIIGHAIGGLVNFDGEHTLVYLLIYQFHMPLLFAVSGYVTKEYTCDENRSSMWPFVKKQFVGLYIPYIFWGIIYWCVKFFVFQGNNPVTVKDLFMLPINNGAWPAGWFLLTLFIVKVIDRALCEMHIPFVLQGTIWGVCVVLTFVVTMPGIVYNSLFFGSFFFFGKVIKRYSFRAYIICGTIICSGLVGGYLFAQGELVYSKPFLSLGISWLIFFVYSKTNIYVSWINILGRYSMIPYVVHVYVTIICRVILDRMNCTNFYVYAIVESVIAIGICLIATCIITRQKYVMILFYPSRIKALVSNRS